MTHICITYKILCQDDLNDYTCFWLWGVAHYQRRLTFFYNHSGKTRLQDNIKRDINIKQHNKLMWQIGKSVLSSVIHVALYSSSKTNKSVLAQAQYHHIAIHGLNNLLSLLKLHSVKHHIFCRQYPKKGSHILFLNVKDGTTKKKEMPLRVFKKFWFPPSQYVSKHGGGDTVSSSQVIC